MSDSSGSSKPPDLGALRADLKSAEAAVRHWEAQVVHFKKEAAALDGLYLGFLMGVMGTKEARKAEALRNVALAEAGLAQIRGKVQEAKAALQGGQQATTAAADAKAERVGEQEMHADEIRGTADGAALVEIERTLAEAQARHAATTEVLQAGGGLVVALSGVIRDLEKVSDATRDDALNIGWAGLEKLWHGNNVAQGLQGYKAKASRFQRALRAAGASFRVGGLEEEAPAAIWELLTDNGWAELAQLSAVDDQRWRLEAHRDELRSLLDGFQRESREAKEGLGELERRREALLVRSEGAS